MTDARVVIEQLRKSSISDLDTLFKVKTLPEFKELEGETAGSLGRGSRDHRAQFPRFRRSCNREGVGGIPPAPTAPARQGLSPTRLPEVVLPPPLPIAGATS